MWRAKNGSKVMQTIVVLKDFSMKNPTVCSDLPNSKWFKSYGLSKLKIMSETLKMAAPHPNDSALDPFFDTLYYLPSKYSDQTPHK